MSIEDRQAEAVTEIQDILETMSPTSQDYKDLEKELDLENGLFADAYECGDDDAAFDSLDRLELLAMSLRK